MFVVAAGLRLWGINFGLPALYRPDEDVTVGRAMGVFHGILNPHFADWPHLYFYVAAAWLAPLRLLGLVSDPASGYLGIRILDALLGSLTVLVVFEFGRRAYGWLAGFFGAAALAVAFLHVRDSHFATLDIPLTLACVATLYVAYRTIRLRGLRPLLINGVSLGVAASLKYNGALVFAGIAAAQTLRARAELTRRPRWLARLALAQYQTYSYQPGYAQPAPAYGQSAYGQPAYGQPAYGQPAYGTSVSSVAGRSRFISADTSKEFCRRVHIRPHRS